MATIKDIARISGVGLGTVSRVLNGGANVRKSTMDRVIEAAKKLNYQPNSAARVLARGRYARTTIGVVLPVLVHPFYLEIVKGIYDGLMEDDYNLLLFNTGNDRRTVFEHIIQESLAGILFVGRGLSVEEKRILELNHSTYVMVDFQDPDADSIYIDNHAGGIQAADFIISQGLKNIAYIGDKSDSQQQDERFAGFVEEMLKQGLRLKHDIRVPMMREHAYKATQELLMADPAIDGIFYFCDDFAMGGLKALKDSNSRVRIVGFDDLGPAEYLELTTVRQPANKMGHAAARRMLEIIRNPSQDKKQKVLKPELIIRNT